MKKGSKLALFIGFVAAVAAVVAALSALLLYLDKKRMTRSWSTIWTAPFSNRAA